MGKKKKKKKDLKATKRTIAICKKRWNGHTGFIVDELKFLRDELRRK